MKQYRIGLILGTKETDYPRQIRMGVQNTLEAAGHILINIADLIPYHTHTRSSEYMRVALELAKRIDLDAVIVPLGTLFGYLGNDQELTDALIHILDPKRTIVLEREVEGYRCITKNGVPGMQACMRHLIEDFGLKKIGFVSGPATSVGARQREQVYFDEMAAHGLHTDDTWFSRGEFSGVCDWAIERILDNHPDVEAIACASDLIAFTCYRVLRERGYVIGEDVAVTGFDDHPAAAQIDPPLSTVRITGYELGVTGAREALRLCHGEEQDTRVLSSTFIARGSCGENRIDELSRFVNLLKERPFPSRKVADLLAEDTLTMAGPRFTATYTDLLERLVQRLCRTFESHVKDPDKTDHLFSERDFYMLFPADSISRLSLTGFHNRVVDFLEALSTMADHEHAVWIGKQISELHLHMMRLQSTILSETTLLRDKREYFSFRVAEDTLLQEHDGTSAYQMILEELQSLGVDQADLFLLEEPIPVSAKNSIALSDTVTHIASLHDDKVSTPNTSRSLLHILAELVPSYTNCDTLTFTPLMAGHELVGLMLLYAPRIGDNGQLMATLDVGIALKLLQMLSIEREMNEILSQNNLLLERQSTHDEMTGILNRRGLMDAMQQALATNPHSQAAVYYFDLDGLKYINDNLGHDIGDEAIKMSAALIHDTLPKGCLVGRMGGDEFVAFSLVQDELEARALIERVMCAFDNPLTNKGRAYALSISCGMQMVKRDGDARERISESLSAADTKMYAMKAQHHSSRCFTDMR